VENFGLYSDFYLHAGTQQLVNRFDDNCDEAGSYAKRLNPNG